MSSLKSTDPSALIGFAVAGILLIVAAVFYGLPKPSITGQLNGTVQQKAKYDAAIRDGQGLLEKHQGQIDSETWTGPMATLAPTILKSVTKFAAANFLQVTAFRPLKDQSVSNVNSTPILVTVQGTFPNTLKFLRQLENPANKVGISQTQLVAQGQNSTNISTSVQIVAWRATNS